MSELKKKMAYLENAIVCSGATKAMMALLENNARSATVFLREDLSVTATLLFKLNKRDRSRSAVLTWGKPNFRGRQFVKACLKRGEPFPVKKVQLKFWPKKK